MYSLLITRDRTTLEHVYQDLNSYFPNLSLKNISKDLDVYSRETKSYHIIKEKWDSKVLS